MPLVYRAVLHDSDGAITSAVEPLFRQWLVDKKLVDEDFQIVHGTSTPLMQAENPTWLQHHHVPGRGKSQDELRRLRLVEESPEDRWITTVVWRRAVPTQEALSLDVKPTGEQLALTDHVFRTGPWVWVDLEHEPLGGRPLQRPGSPRLVRSLMAAGEAYDSTLPLTAEPFTVRAGHVKELAGFVRDPDRRVPVVVFAHDSKRAYDQANLSDRLARDLAGVAAVFVLADAQATHALAQALPPDYAVYGGALRTYLPGAGQGDDSPSRHRVLGRVSLTALGPRAFPALKDQVLQLSTRRPAPVDSFLVRRQAAILTTPPPTAPAARPAPTADTPLQWLSHQVRRIRSALSQRLVEPEFSDVGAAQTALAGEVDQLLERALEQPGLQVTPAPSEERQQLTEQLARIEQDRTLLETLFGEASNELESANASLAEVRGSLSGLRDDH